MGRRRKGEIPRERAVRSLSPADHFNYFGDVIIAARINLPTAVEGRVNEARANLLLTTSDIHVYTRIADTSNIYIYIEYVLNLSAASRGPKGRFITAFDGGQFMIPDSTTGQTAAYIYLYADARDHFYRAPADRP